MLTSVRRSFMKRSTAFRGKSRLSRCSMRIPISLITSTNWNTTRRAPCCSTYRVRTENNCMTPCYLIVAPLAATISLCAMGFAHADESASVLTEQQALQSEEYIYKSTTDGRVEVFSLSKKFVYSEGAEYLLRRDGRHRGEFAGQIVICSSNRYQCIRGGVYAVVPAAPAGEEHWSFRGITCSADAPLSRNKGNTVRCTFRG